MFFYEVVFCCFLLLSVIIVCKFGITLGITETCMGNVSFQNLQRQNAAIVIQKYIRTLLAKEEMNRRQRMQRARRKVEFIELVAE